MFIIINKIDTLNDAYMKALEEAELEIKEQCDECFVELYRGDEVVVDGINTFCDFFCANTFHGIEETDLFPKGSTCDMCGEVLYDEFETYTNADGEFFCSSSCAEERAELHFETL